VRIRITAAGALERSMQSWGSPGRLLSSRYHGSLVGAWAGSSVLVIERSEKMRGLVAQLGMSALPAVEDANTVRQALQIAQPVSRDRLLELARRAADSCRELLERCSEAQEMHRENVAALADLSELQSRLFQSFMGLMNAFASSLGLRTSPHGQRSGSTPGSGMRACRG